jgi:prepilin-type N-terminal cleavage/methylation domain-containing protein
MKHNLKSFKFQFSNSKNIKGFTLVELIVVMAVFLLIIGTAIGIFISIVQDQRRILNEQELLNQTSYALEHMSKALRMAKKDTEGNCLGQDYIGYNYLLTRWDGTRGAYNGIKFINQSDNDACQEFFLEYIDSNHQELGFVLKEIKKYNPAELDNPVLLTSSKLKINSIGFNVIGASENDGVQPRITISLDIQVQGDSNQPRIKIQTTVSQRNLNVK